MDDFITIDMNPNCSTKVVRRLPKELQDAILEFTLIASLEDSHETWPPVVQITPEHRTPWQLAINSASRRIVAGSYDSRTAFNCGLMIDEGFESACISLIVAFKWLTSLPKTHLAHIRELRIPSSCQEVASGSASGSGATGLGSILLLYDALANKRGDLTAMIRSFVSDELQGLLPSLKVEWRTMSEDGTEGQCWLNSDDIDRMLEELRLAGFKIVKEMPTQQEQ